MKINFNITSIQNRILPNLNNGIDLLNSAINKEYNLYIPREFIYYNELNQMIENNIDSKKKLQDVANYFYKLNKVFDNSLGDINTQLVAIDNVQIKKRQSSIK